VEVGLQGRLVLFDNAQAFLDAAGEMLYAQETVNNLILGVSERLVRDPNAYENPFFACFVNAEGEVLLAAVMTPPHNLILAGIDDFEMGITPLITHFKQESRGVPGVIGPVHMVEPFVRVWESIIGQATELSMNQRVYELRSVEMPPMLLGQFRCANPPDIPVITHWFQAFESEALRETHALEPQRVAKMVNEGQFFLWDRSGMPVSMAMYTRPIAHSITVSGVYTPPAKRRQGYATALVAHLSQHLLDEGYQFVNLFTDLANPTSNAIYQKIGYQLVCDFCVYTFMDQVEVNEG
jgi:predicted GNAT family acetyltransferase